MEKEIWRNIKGYDRYQISNYGNVRSCYNNGKIRYLKKHIRNGYYYIQLSKKGKIKQNRINRLVAEAFIPNPNNYPCVNHIDGNKLNNKVDNLEWCTFSYNLKEAYRLNLRKPVKEAKPFYQLDLNKNVINEFRTLKEAEEKTGINETCIMRRLKDGKEVRGYLWRYKKQ